MECSRHGQHLAHSGAALWAFVSNNHNITGFDFTLQDRRHGILFAFEHACRSFEPQVLHSCNLHDGTFRSEIPFQYANRARLVDRLRYRTNHFVLVAGGNVSKIFLHCFSRNGHRIAVEKARVEEHLQHPRHSAHAIEIGHHVSSAGAQVDDMRRAVGYAIEVVDRQWHAGLVRNRKQVQHRVG